MRFFVLIVFVLTFFFVPHRLSAAMDSPPAINNPPVSTGTLFGNRGMYFQMLVNNPRADLTNNGSIEGMTLLEYKPLISESWRFYSRYRCYTGSFRNGVTMQGVI